MKTALPTSVIMSMERDYMKRIAKTAMVLTGRD